MFVRSSARRNKDGTVVRYLQLAHNEWDPASKSSKTKVLHNFGREDQLDRPAVERLVTSLCRLLDPERAATVRTPGELNYQGSAGFGGAYLLDQLWRQLSIDKIMTSMLARTRRGPYTERVLFALVANRALDASSKLAASHWVGRRAHIESLASCSDDACYRAMDWLHECRDAIENKVFDQVATLLNLQVDLLFFDTTSTYFEIDTPDEAIDRDERGMPLPDDCDAGEEPAMRKGFRAFGKSKDHRDDLPQVVIGLAVTRDGIPVRCWCWPGGTADATVISQVKKDMRDWTLAKIVWVGDRGFTSEDNRRTLRSGDHHYILGEKLRSGSPEAKAALARQGRYTDVAGNLKVKEVRISEHERFVICFNPDGADRDAAVRERLLAHLGELIDGTDGWKSDKRAELRGVISTKPALNRYLRVTAGGLLRIDQAKVKAEAKLDGKYLLRSSDPRLSAEDIALGFKQLWQVERGWRDMKQIIDLRPVYHRLEQRIRAHVILCWLALLLIRIIETGTGRTWRHIREEFDQLTIATFTGPTGTFRQIAELTKPQRDILAKLALPIPKKVIEAIPATPS
ncbi:IS1634 family transposase [Nonomuraea turkmeniaca]|uniref:IS1634 family transposase n=1 Tax=Nonomuraea turkmeniaca TaxID=103838 RepID=A0A5S4EU51_9ACTN|nr:IS1634 family transposase [Nonomuraea turkmeniaca]TMR02644.1 IS1634 family transposase [Nonomuraea turkmeniaca]